MAVSTSHIGTRALTPEDVLACFVDWHRHTSPFDPEMDSEAVLGFDTTVQEWRSACDLVRWRKLGKALNAEFGTSFSLRQWRGVLTPPRQRRLREVCDLIASAAVAPEISPVLLLGRPCLIAGAFFLVRDLLAKRGADVSRLRPSSELETYLRDCPEVFTVDLSRVAPGRLPSLQMHRTGRNVFAWIGWAGVLGVATSAYLDYPCTTVTSVFTIVFGWIGSVASSKDRYSLQLGTLRTFRDLCCTLVGDEKSISQPMD